MANRTCGVFAVAGADGGLSRIHVDQVFLNECGLFVSEFGQIANLDF